MAHYPNPDYENFGKTAEWFEMNETLNPSRATDSYRIFVVYVDGTNAVVAKPLLEAPYDFNTALDCVDSCEAHVRDKTKPFGSFQNPLRYEARSPGGIAERFQ